MPFFIGDIIPRQKSIIFIIFAGVLFAVIVAMSLNRSSISTENTAYISGDGGRVMYQKKGTYFAKMDGAEPDDIANDRIKLEISKRGSNYFWSSNKNQRLKKVDRHGLNQDGEETMYSVFISEDGDGQIIVRHDPQNKLCDQPIPNYFEYRLNNFGRLDFYIGTTDSYPYPNPHTRKFGC